MREFDGINSRMTYPQYKEVKRAFELFTKPFEEITKQNFEEIVKMLNLQEESDIPDVLTYKDYIYEIQPLIEQRDNVNHEVKAFKILDIGQTGVLTVQDILMAAQACQLDIDEKEAGQMLSLTGPSVTEGEFLKVMNRIQ